ncbi:MAG: DNA topoisomerase IV subunit A [Pseudomonadota bacterium]
MNQNHSLPTDEKHVIDFGEALKERYLAYALSTITSRSLPDARDGLKPVHRRILYAMHMLNLEPDAGYKKCARIVGDVMGKFHPHGDQAIYDAMVRLAQTFAVRYPLVDGQGNFGNIDGDNPAAMRYTEARMSNIAKMLLEGLDENAVDFVDTYDGSENEPVVLPASFPNCLANGAAGIAVGMATSIPPHNLIELMQAMIALIKNPSLSDHELLSFVPGPDFPTGGTIIDDESFTQLKQIYLNGRGSIRLRANWKIEKTPSSKDQIIIYQIPFGVSKSKLIEKIAELLDAKKLPYLQDIRDESSEIIRLVLIPSAKRINLEQMMESLFNVSDLEIRFSVNMNVLLHEGKIPRLSNLREMLQAFITYRIETQKRITNYRIHKIETRLEILKGYLIAYQNLDQIIAIIRDEDHPKPILMEKFDLNTQQVEAVLNMRLRALRKLEQTAIEKEAHKLTKELENLIKLINSKNDQYQKIAQYFLRLHKDFEKNPDLFSRRTQIVTHPNTTPLDLDQFEREAVTLVCSKAGWVRLLKGHTHDPKTLKFREDDDLHIIVKAYSNSKFIFAFDNGKFYTLHAHKLPMGRGYGEPLSILLDLSQADILSAIVPFQNHLKLLLASDTGYGFLVEAQSILSQTRFGKQIMKLPPKTKMIKCIQIEGDMVACITENRKFLVFKVDEIPLLRRGRGVILQRCKNTKLSDIATFSSEEGIKWPVGSRIRVQKDITQWQAKRAAVGCMPPYGFPQSNLFYNITHESDD